MPPPTTLPGIASYRSRAKFTRNQLRFTAMKFDDKRKRYRRSFSTHHLVFCLPGWIKWSLSKQERRELATIGPKIIDAARLDTRYRLFFHEGLELEMAPHAYGLKLSWFYHSPIVDKGTRTSRIPLREYADDPSVFRHQLQGRINLERDMLAADPFIPWSRLGPGKNASSHEKIQFAAAKSDIPKDHRALKTRLILIKPADSRVLRFAAVDILANTILRDDRIVLMAGPHSDHNMSKRALDPDVRDICVLNRKYIEIAARRLERDVACANFFKRTHIRLSNMAAGYSDILSVFRRWLRSKT